MFVHVESEQNDTPGGSRTHHGDETRVWGALCGYASCVNVNVNGHVCCVC